MSRTIASSQGTSVHRAAEARAGVDRTRRARPVRVAVSAAVLFLAPGALASPDYPTAIQDELGTPCVPQCTLCHTTNPGRAGTASQPFVNTLKVPGMNTSGLRTAIRALAADQSADAPDTDGDGVSDVDELLQGHDPNVEGAGDICALDVRYGCGARVEPRGAVSPLGPIAAVLTVLGLVLLVRRRTVS